ncbi:hypothetical protein Q5H93_10075 [Hymenobacter sp. ASUV-10]|uniref:Cation/H+ exchanger domain-containing protein n=1 Tax=Hymenobacter aranciens TaxID=3063996 RepID=A0ABT9B9X6_9BACT|nr:hypothetical protein [Hymenobacter sp. ASUV-10]MDO7875077.1 hypothetical protein [Hymenobacter sp. ASUV-10]
MFLLLPAFGCLAKISWPYHWRSLVFKRAGCFEAGLLPEALLLTVAIYISHGGGTVPALFSFASLRELLLPAALLRPLTNLVKVSESPINDSSYQNDLKPVPKQNGWRYAALSSE